MCGIAGIIGNNRPLDINVLLKSLEHRGHDGISTYAFENIQLGMTRLAINDLSHNPYPMRYKNLVLIFNGEIYNYQDLAKFLIKKRIHLETHCDAEVILPLYDIYGMDFLNKIEGMFAMCIFDYKNRKLYLARDRAGEKPLYYVKSSQGFVFASEIRSIINNLSQKNNIGIETLQEYLKYGYISGENTLINDIFKLEPGKILTYDLNSNRISVVSYWKPHFKNNIWQGSEAEAVNQLDDLISNSVKLRLLSDVPVGCFLSGGIDSSLIALYASKYTNNLKTFSVIFPASGKYNEKSYSAYAAKILNTDHIEIECTENSISEYIQNIGHYIDEPISDPAILPTLLMSKVAKKDVSVILTGEGADELFGGYERYRRQISIEMLRDIPFTRSLAQIVHGIFPHRFDQTVNRFERRYHAQQIWRQTEELLPKMDYENSDGLTILNNESLSTLIRMQLTDFNSYLPHQLLMKIDKSTMNFALEARAPFLDTSLINYAFSLQDKLKYNGNEGKYILKILANRYFPKKLVWRKKHGFEVPLAIWFRRDLKGAAYHAVDVIEEKLPIINTGYCQQIINKHETGKYNYADRIWNLVILAGWLSENRVSYV